MKWYRYRVQLKGCIFIIMALFATAVTAQEYLIEGLCERQMRGKARLIVYDGDSSRQTYVARFNENRFVFNGNVASVVLSELQLPGYPPLFFYLEQGKTTIVFDSSVSAVPRVNGSRSNSQYRYILEQCRNSDFESCIIGYIQANPTSVFSPFLIYNHLKTIDADRLAQLVDGLSGEAVHTYHYHLLRKQVATRQSLAVGSALPDVVLPSKQQLGKVCASYAGKYLLLTIGASWCEQCQRVGNHIDSLVEQNPSVAHFNVNIDDDRRLWDAPVVQQLAIDHIPYIIVIGPDGRILSRDPRYWELHKLLPQAQQ